MRPSTHPSFHPLGAAPQPTEPTPPCRHRHAPGAGLLTFQVMPTTPQLGLVSGLPADAEGLSDLCPGSAVAACGCGQEIACIGQGFLGVSYVAKCVQRPLGTPQGQPQVLDHSTYPPAREGACFGTHVNRYWQRPRTAAHEFRSIPIDRENAANSCKRSISRKEVNGAPSGDISSFGDYVRRPDPIFGSTQPKKETPQERQLLGVVDDIRGN